MSLHTPPKPEEKIITIDDSVTSNNIAATFDLASARNMLVQLVDGVPGITVNETKSGDLVIIVSDLRAVDGIVKNNSSTHGHTAKLAKTIYAMLNQGLSLSVTIETFVGKPYLLHSMSNFPTRDIGEAVKYACEARSNWAKQRITKPEYKLEQLFNPPVDIIEGKCLSDNQELIYTIKFKSEDIQNN